MEIPELKKKTEELRELIEEVNDRAKALEGEGCTVKFQVDKPFNIINFVLVNKDFKL